MINCVLLELELQPLVILHLLLLLRSQSSLLLLSPEDLFLLIDELEKLLTSHGQDLVESSKHKPFKVLVRNAKNRGTMSLELRVRTVEDIV